MTLLVFQPALTWAGIIAPWFAPDRGIFLCLSGRRLGVGLCTLFHPLRIIINVGVVVVARGRFGDL